MFKNIPDMVAANGVRQAELGAKAVWQSNMALFNIQKVMSALAVEMGIYGAWLDNNRVDVLEGEAFHEHGDELSVLALHSQALMAAAGIEKESSLFTAPWAVSQDAYALGMRPFLDTREDAMPVSLNMVAMSASLEHALCMHLGSQGMTWEDWEQRSFDPEDRERDISLEEFVFDLEQNWAALMTAAENGELQLADPAEVVKLWPELLTREKIKDNLDAYQRISGRIEKGQSADNKQDSLLEMLTQAKADTTAAPAPAQDAAQAPYADTQRPEDTQPKEQEERKPTSAGERLR